VVKLNLGCGPIDPNDDVHTEGWTRVDIDPSVEPDLIVDLRAFPWPWEDGSIEEIFSAHYVEHQTSIEWISFVEELYRILEPGAMVTIVHPNLKSARAFSDPTHLDHIPAERWLYANKQWRTEGGLDRPPYPRCDFGIVNMIFGNFEPGLEFRSADAQQSALAGRWDAAQDIMAQLVKKD
jgi:predicted SAM-dependent methyltransferase